jgi:acyl-CoA thioesterase-1
MSRLRRVAAIAAALLLLVTPVAVSTSSPSSYEVQSQVGSPWCPSKASMALIASSSGTGSMTTGYSSPDGTYAATAYGWWSRVTRQFNSYWGTTQTNYSRGSAHVSDFLPGGRWLITTGATADIAVKQPSLVIISLGTNEYVEQVPPTTFEANLNTLISDIRAAAPSTTIYLTTQWEVNMWNPVTYPYANYTAAIRSAAVNHGTGLMDLRQYIIPGTSADWPMFYHPDRGHLLDVGHMVVAAAWSVRLAAC